MLRYAAAWPLLLASAAAAADSTEEQPQSRADAWWTGPMLAPNAATLPRGYALLEPYLFDIITSGHFDANGNKHAGPIEHDLGSLTYMLYGVTNNITAGLIPRFLFEEPAGAANSSGIRLGDLTLQLGYGLAHFHDGGRTPVISLVLQETLPTGSYDRLTRASDGVGAGAYTTSINLYLQDYFWMPNGRILRQRQHAGHRHRRARRSAARARLGLLVLARLCAGDRIQPEQHPRRAPRRAHHRDRPQHRCDRDTRDRREHGPLRRPEPLANRPAARGFRRLKSSLTPPSASGTGGLMTAVNGGRSDCVLMGVSLNGSGSWGSNR